MLGRRKEEIAMMKKALEGFEASQKNTELVVTSFYEMISQEKQEIVRKAEEEREEKRKANDFDKVKAALALNMCMVSVSQIIDYNDSNILDQEYDTILNNLNLENMPKDEALLNILKQLLDTITFFKIQEKEKEFIEKEYQQKMKNAIWSAVPNFGLIVAAGNPVMMLTSLATQVGIGYMNYRKTKAENSLEKEKQEWQLQRAAMEQLNGLRRELFDASWRLAEKYKFKDEYRLTERQIAQYNKILMDSDLYRRYERLEAIKGNFEAYPPFWYYFGNTANSIANIARIDGNSELYEEYRGHAINYFKTYKEKNQESILREDQIASACALEYIDLLDVKKDKEEIQEELDLAIKSSGFACDVLQLCALSYLRIGELESAMRWLSYLVNEGYNTAVNAQLLSSLYACNSIVKRTYLNRYTILAKKVPAEILFPFPKEESDSVDVLKKKFVAQQRIYLFKRYENVLYLYCEKCAIMLNKCIPIPDEHKIYSDTFFSEKKSEERINQYKVLLSNEKKATEYLTRLAESDFAVGYLEVFNRMMNDIVNLLPGVAWEKAAICDELVGIIEEKLKSNAENFAKVQERLDVRAGFSGMEVIFNKLNFGILTKEYFERIYAYLQKHVSVLDKMTEFAEEETNIRSFCNANDLPEPDILINNSYMDGDMNDKKVEYFSGELLGGKVFEKAEDNALARQLAKIARKYIGKIVVSDKKDVKAYFYVNFFADMSTEFNTCYKQVMAKYKKKDTEGTKIFAILSDEGFWSKEKLVFTTEGIILDKSIGKNNATEFGAVERETNAILLGKDKFDCKHVDIGALYDLLQELSEEYARYSNQKNNSGTYNAIPMSNPTAYITSSDDYNVRWND